MDILLWILFLTGQVLNTGNMNWQQDNNYIELNPLYGSHPTRLRIYVTKILQTLLIFGVFWICPNILQIILMVLVNIVVWGILYYDLKIIEVPRIFKW